MAAKSREKGYRGENEVVRILRAAGLPARRVSPLEAGGEEKGDVEIGGRVAQVKLGSHVPMCLGRWMKDADMLIVRRDRQPWLVVQTLEDWLETSRSPHTWSG